MPGMLLVQAGRRVGVIVGLLLVGALLPTAALAADEIKFTTQPIGGLPGQPFAVQPVISVMNGTSLDAGAAGTVTLALRYLTGTPGAVLTCTGSGPSGLMFPVSSGVATATGCSIDRAGTGYVLMAIWNAGGAVESDGFSVSSTVSSRLAFTTQAGGGAPGVAWAIQPVVTIQDSTGATLTGSSATVAIAITPGTGSGGAVLNCAGGLSRSAVNGVAVFAGCSIDAIGVGYTLTATSAGSTASTSAAFSVAQSGSPAKVGFVTQPARGIANTAFAVQPAAAIQDANGSTVASSSAFITLALSSNSNSATLYCGGGNPRAALVGVAAFSGCSIDRPGVGYTLIASSSGLSSAASSPFDVADRLAFLVQPATGIPGGVLAPQPAVAVKAGDATAVHDQGTVVTLAIDSGTGTRGATLTCTGGLSRTAIAGVATFDGCSIDRASGSQPYRLVATASNLPSILSDQFTIGGTAPTPGSVAWAATGSALGNTLTGPFTAATKIQSIGGYITWKVDGGTALAGQTIQVWVYKKYSATGAWAGPTMLTTRKANASGVAYINIHTGGVLWLSLRPVLPATATTAASWGPTSIGRWR